jgi:hypothetical protein
MSSTTGKGKAIFRVVSGNFLEMFDFMVYGFYATKPSSPPTAPSLR